eukprot:gene30135-35111_t
MAVAHEIMAAPVDELCRLIYPSLYPLHDPSGNWGMDGAGTSSGGAAPVFSTGEVPLPTTLPLSLPHLSDQGAYLMDNGRVFILWLGRMLHKEWATEVFGVDVHSVADPSQLSVEPARESPMSKVGMVISG